MPHHLTRRQVALGIAASCAPVRLRASRPLPLQAVDVHHHFYPPALLEVLRRNPPTTNDPMMSLVEQ